MGSPRRAVATIGKAGYRFFHYAPKAELKLRKRWQEPFTPEEVEAIRHCADQCHDAGMRFGVGLTPFGAHLDFSPEARAALKQKLAALDDCGINDLAILFDDMEGAIADLAERQADILTLRWTIVGRAASSPAPAIIATTLCLIACSVRGLRNISKPWGAWSIQRGMAVAIYWTGEEVCAREISLGHVHDVADRLGRKPALWDNYPVNDGPRMSQHLHLRSFTGRSAVLADGISHHAINPASQPMLSCIPALTLPMVYVQGWSLSLRRSISGSRA